jgi:hypothetical protein
MLNILKNKLVSPNSLYETILEAQTTNLIKLKNDKNV